MSWEKEDAWSKKQNARRPRGRSRPGSQPKADTPSEDSSTWATSKRKAEKRQKRRRLGWIVGGIALALLILVALLPTIASAFAPGIIAGAGSDAIAGRVEVERVGLSWFGAQRVEGIRLYDTDDTRRSDLDITVKKGLLGLALAGGDYGTVTITGSLDASNNDDGEPFTEHTVKPTAQSAPAATSPTPGPPALPKGLRVTLELDDLQVQYADPARTKAGAPIEAVRLDELSGSIAINANAQSKIDLDGVITRKATGAALFDKAGTLTIDATATDLADADGTLTPDAATIDATVKAESIETAIAELFADLQANLPDALGDTVGLTLTANGSMNNLHATLAFDSAAAKLNAPLTVNLGARTVASDDALTADLDTERLSRLVPDRDALLGPDADVEVTTYPAVNVAITDLALTLPESGAPDLRGSGATIAINLGALAGRIADPTTGTPRTVGLEPSTITIAAPDLANGASINGAIGTAIDGARSGTLAIDLAARDLLDDAGAMKSGGLPTIEGAVRAEQLTLQALQPIATAFGFDLVGTLGETADLAIQAAPGDGNATSLTIAGSAPHAAIDGAFTYDGAAIRTNARPLTVRLDKPDAALAPFLAGAGVEITGATGLNASLDNLNADLERIAAGDLRLTGFTLTATLARLDAALKENVETGSAQPARPTSASITDLRAEISAADLADGLRLFATQRFTLDGAPAGSSNTDITVAGILDENGAPIAGVPATIRGVLGLSNVRTAALAPFVPIDLLDLPADIGPAIDLTLNADAPEPGTTRVTLGVASEHLTGSGDATIRGGRITARGETLRLELTGAGPLATRLAKNAMPGLEVSGTQLLRVMVNDLDLPIDAAGDPTSAEARVTLGLRSWGLRNNGDYAGSLRVFDAIAQLTPGEDPTLRIKGDVLGNDPRFTNGQNRIGTIEGEFTLANAFTPADENGRTAIAPNGTLTATGLPVTLARLAGTTFPGKEDAPPITLTETLHGLAGETITLGITTARDAAASNPHTASITVTLDTDAGPHTFDATVDLAPTADGAFAIADLSADAKAILNTPVVRTALGIAMPGKPGQPGSPSTVTVANQGSLALTVRNDGGTLRTNATIAPTVLQGIAIPSKTPGSAAQPLAPVTLEGLVNITAPFAMLTAPDGTHKVSLNADVKGTDPAQPSTPVLALTATADATLAGSVPTGPVTADVRLDSSRTAWLDALAGMNGMLTEALGDRVRLTSQFSAEFATPPSDAETSPMPKSARATASIDAPRLRTARPASLVIQDDTLRLTEPFSGVWTFTPELFATLAPTEPGKAAQASLASNANITFTANKLVFPLGAGNTKPIDLDAGLTAPDIPLRFTDGSTYTLTDLNASLTSMPNDIGTAGKDRILVSASTRETPGTNAISIDSTITGLPAPGVEFTPDAITLDGVAEVNALPMPLVDALAGADGAIVTFLGSTLDMSADLKGLPQKGGTITFRADTPQSNARYNAAVQAHPRDANTLALVARGDTTATITHFDYSIQGKKIAMLPVFAGVRKIENTHRPATVRITQLVNPVDGDLEKIILAGTVDPGVVEYDIDRGLAALLELAKQRTTSNAGERLEPFNVAMDKGVARFDSLRVPIGEFTLAAEGSFDLVRQYEDITLGVPAGAFAGEVIGNLPGAASGLLNKDVLVPVRRKGPMGADNKWEPDFQAVIKQLFSPEKILDNVIKGGLKDLFGGG